LHLYFVLALAARVVVFQGSTAQALVVLSVCGNGSVVVVVVVVVVVAMHHTPSDERWRKGRARGGSL
jgi:hypothetical protein